MNVKSTFLVTLGIIVSALMVPSATAFSLRDLLGMGEEETTADQQDSGELMGNRTTAPAQTVIPEDQNWGKPVGPVAKAEFDPAVIQRVLQNVDANQRSAVLADPETFKRFVQQEADAASLLQAARANKLQQDPNVAFLMQRGADNLLREIYLNRLISSKIPAGFPTEEQLKKYFDDNKDKLVIPERLQVWQIYFPYEKDMDAKAKAALLQKADGIAKDLKDSKISFSDAAQKYSKHEASRQKGGDMGLVSINDLKPQIKGPLLALPEGQISAPVQEDAGIHILKRGAKTAAQPLEYAAIKDQLKQVMLKQATLQLRNAVLDQARKTYPVELEDKKVEEMRLRLRTDLAPPAKQSAAAKPAT